MNTAYDFVICGAGSSASVVARWLAKNTNVKVLLPEAGGTDDLPSRTDPNSGRRPSNRSRVAF